MLHRHYQRVSAMFRTLFTAFLALLVPFCALAATFGPTEQLNKGDVLRGRFVQEHYIKEGTLPVRSEGHFLIAPPYGVIWAIERPLPLTVTATKDGALQSIGNVPLLRQSPAQLPYLSHVTTMLSNALGGNLKALEPDFIMRNGGTAKQWRVKLTPRSQKAMNFPFKSITAKGSRFVEQAELIRPSGFSDVFTFSSQAITSDVPSEAEMALFAAVTKEK